MSSLLVKALSERKVPRTAIPEQNDFLAAVKKYREWAGGVLVFIKNSSGVAKAAAEAISASNIHIDAAIIVVPPILTAAGKLLDAVNIANCKHLFEIDGRRRAIIGEAPAIAMARSPL